MDVSAVVANWKTFAALAPDCAAVIKADAYGLGADSIAPALAKAGCQSFFASTLEEAKAARRILGPGPVIYALNGPSPEDAAGFAEAAIVPVVNTLAQLALAPGPFALHVDTGMNRLGLPPSDLSRLDGRVPDLVMSHLACGGEPGHPLNARQRAAFEQAAALFPTAKKSLAATGGAQLGAPYRFDMIRVGVGLYGSPDRTQGGLTLACAARIDAPILQVRRVAAGESIGYGASYVAAKSIDAAAVAIGYADGCLRSLAGRGYGVVGGVKHAILGRVSMDLVMLDVTGCAEARPGAMVEFLGPEAPLDEVAACAGTNAYEILTTFVGGVRRGQS